jgi:hypothetical protein
MRTKAVHIFATGFALLAACPAHAAWTYEKSIDKFDDSLVSYAHGSAPGGSMWVRCKGDVIETYFATVFVYIGNEDAAVRYRIDKGEVDEDYWSTSTEGDALFAPHPAATAREMAAGSRLAIEAMDFQDTPHTYSLSLSGSGAAINKVLADCGIPARNPRDSDPEIWRRVVDSLEEVPRSTIRNVQSVLNQLTGAGLPETGVRTTATYQTASRFYEAYWTDCEAGNNAGKKCKDWNDLRKYSDDPDYTGNFFELLIERMESPSQ